MMPAAACFPPGIAEEQLLADLRRLCWGAADILLAYGRGEQPPYGFPKALSVDEGGEVGDLRHIEEAAEEHGATALVIGITKVDAHTNEAGVELGEQEA